MRQGFAPPNGFFCGTFYCWLTGIYKMQPTSRCRLCPPLAYKMLQCSFSFVVPTEAGVNRREGSPIFSKCSAGPPNLVCLRTPRRGPTVNFEGEIWGCVQTVYKFWNTMVLYTDYAYRLILLKRESFRPFWQKIISNCWIPSVEMHFCKAFWDQGENNTVVGLERRKFDWCLGKVANLDFSFMIIIWMISLIYLGPFSCWKGVPLQRAWTSQCLPFALQTWLLLGASLSRIWVAIFLGIWYCFFWFENYLFRNWYVFVIWRFFHDMIWYDMW